MIGSNRLRIALVAAVVAVAVAAVAVAVSGNDAPPGETSVRPGRPQVQVPRVVRPVMSRGPVVGPKSAVSREAQSRLWFAYGTWWGLLSDTAGAQRIFEFTPDHSWRDTSVIVDDRARSTADALWDGEHVVTASRTAGGAVEVSRLTFSTAARTWSIDAGFPVKVAGGGMLVATITRDTTGTLWLAYVQAGQVWYSHSVRSDATWAPPARFPGSTTPVKDEDIAAIVAFSGHVGVLWSDQVGGAFRFASHTDGAPAEQWTVEPLPLRGPFSADNHVSVKASRDGQVVAVVKTSFGDRPNRSTAAQVVLLARSVAGSWSVQPVASVATSATRGIALIDDDHGLVYVALTAPEAGGAVYLKATALDKLVFDTGRGQRVLASPGATIVSASASKHNVNGSSGIVILGADEKTGTYFRADIPLV